MWLAAWPWRSAAVLTGAAHQSERQMDHMVFTMGDKIDITFR
jgi:hypothetical protein